MITQLDSQEKQKLRDKIAFFTSEKDRLLKEGASKESKLDDDIMDMTQTVEDQNSDDSDTASDLLQILQNAKNFQLDVKKMEVRFYNLNLGQTWLARGVPQGELQDALLKDILSPPQIHDEKPPQMFAVDSGRRQYEARVGQMTSFKEEMMMLYEMGYTEFERNR